jgi:hypothetical protein
MGLCLLTGRRLVRPELAHSALMLADHQFGEHHLTDELEMREQSIDAPRPLPLGFRTKFS